MSSTFMPGQFVRVKAGSPTYPESGWVTRYPTRKWVGRKITMNEDAEPTIPGDRDRMMSLEYLEPWNDNDYWHAATGKWVPNNYLSTPPHFSTPGPFYGVASVTWSHSCMLNYSPRNWLP